MIIWLILIGILLGKIVLLKKEIRNVKSSLERIINNDTNNVIMMETSDKDIKELVLVLNKSLETLRKLELEYRNGNSELKTSITNISHDLRTPLCAIRGYLDLIDKKNLTKKQGDYWKVIESKVEYLGELTEQLFDFAKSLDINREIEKEKIVINDVLEEVVVSFYGLFKEKKIEPKVEICKSKVVRLLNENMLRRIFENMISNGIKYSEKDFKIKLMANGEIEFRNKATNLDRVSLEKIFNRYYTVRNAKKSSGIGLSIAKQLVLLSGGEIDARYKDKYLIVRIKF